jgi:putative transposase
VFEYNVHVVFVTHRRRELFDPQVAEALVEYLRQMCEAKRWIPWKLNVVPDHAHLFVGLTPSDAPGDAALSLMNNSEFFLQRRYGADWRDEVSDTVWRPGYYVGTVGSATTAQVKAFLRGGEFGEL